MSEKGIDKSYPFEKIEKNVTPLPLIMLSQSAQIYYFRIHKP